MKKLFKIIILSLFLSSNTFADKKTILPNEIAKWDYTCDKEDFKKYVSSEEGCIALQHLGKINKSKKTLIVFLHGDSKINGDYNILKRWGNFSKIINSQEKDVNFFFFSKARS